MQETILITGGTGMFGRHLLPRLCAQERVEKVFVPVHRAAPPISHTKIEMVSGDITRPGLGLDSASAQAVRSQVTTIIHGAAETAFSSKLEVARAINLKGTQNALQLAAQCRRLRALCHLSSVYVAGKRTGTIRENELAHTSGFVNAYEQSKYEAEQLLESQSQRLPISIVRLSTILGSAQDGAVSKLGAIHHALRFYFHGLAPLVPGTPSSPVDLIANEYATESVVALALQTFTPGATWHVCGGRDALGLDELLDLTLLFFHEYRPAWRKRAIEKPTIVDLETFELFVRSIEQLGESTLQESVAVFKHFAPQLAYPKEFNDAATRSRLQSVGVLRPKIRDYYPGIVRFLLVNNWQPACEPALV